VQFIKRHFSRNANIILGCTSEDSLEKNAADNGYCQLNKKISLRRQKFLKQNIIMPKFVRQKSFHDHIIRNYADFYAHYKYTMDNYLKHGLSDGRKYT
jgi:late competence protein required for DNA uptake (superfamily II DNA/RNA helicase)